MLNSWSALAFSPTEFAPANFALASVTESITACSWFVYPFTVFTKFGIKSALLCNIVSIVANLLSTSSDKLTTPL